MSNTLPSPNHRGRALKTAAVSALGAVVFSPVLAACSAPRLQTAPGDIVCSGVQYPTVESGDTFGGLVARDVNTEGTIDPSTEPSVFAQEVNGITFQLGEIAAGRAQAGDTFVIHQGRYDIVNIGVTAGEKQPLPASCVQVESPN